MIRSDQPVCFPPTILAAISSREDGTMLDRGRGFHDAPAVEDRSRFCEINGSAYGDSVFQLITYGDHRSYDKISAVSKTDTTRFCDEVAGDALFTRERGVGLFLPIADCTAAVVYDPVQQFLALLHLGRHATYANLAAKAIEYFAQQGSTPRDIVVWMSPGAKKETYWVDTFEYEGSAAWRGFYEQRDDKYFLDLPGYNYQQLVECGVLPEHMEVSSVNTMTDDNYFSHRAGDVNGRMAVLAMMR